MKKLAIISQKGGAGKTTLAVNLAVAAFLDKKSVAIIDLDPQASACGWHDSRELEDPVVISSQVTRVEPILEEAEKVGSDLIIFDTAPHSEASALQMARLADFILIPCRAATLDLRAINNTLDLCNLAGTKAAVVFNAIPSRSTLGAEAEHLLRSEGIEVCPTPITQRVSFIHSITAGQGVLEYEPKGKASKEIQQLYKYACKHVGIKTKKRAA